MVMTSDLGEYIWDETQFYLQTFTKYPKLEPTVPLRLVSNLHQPSIIHSLSAGIIQVYNDAWKIASFEDSFWHHVLLPKV